MEYHIDTDDSCESNTNKSSSYGCKAIIHKKNFSFSDINNEADVYNYGKPDANLIKKSLKFTNCKIGGDLQKIFATVNKSKGIIQLEKRLLSLETLLKIAVWYFFSFTALFLSKHVIDFNSVDLLLFTGIQLLMSSLLSALNNHLSNRNTTDKPTITHQLLFSLAFIGFMRAVVIYMGLLSIKWVALSFMETVKSSAPLFTLIISFFVLKEKNGIFVQVSIIPIMLGLLLCTAYEVSFNWLGFIAALVSNFAECLQFVLSKIYLGSSLNKINPADFQLYSSVAGFLMIFAMSPYLCEIEDVFSYTTTISVLLMGVVGVSYYLQTQMAWYLMEFLSPVTHSICNTIKCGMAVWLSILVFGNEITLWSGLGSFMVVAGVCLYQKARSVEKENRQPSENDQQNNLLKDENFKPTFLLYNLSVIEEKPSNLDNQISQANIANTNNNP